MTPMTSEKGGSVKTDFMSRESSSSIMFLGNDSVFEDSDCIINGVETPGGSWNPNYSSKTSTTRDILNRSSPAVSKSEADKCYSRLSFNETNNQIVDVDQIDLFYSPKRVDSSKRNAESSVETSTAVPSSSRADTEPVDDFDIDDFDIDDFDETDIPDYYEEPSSVLASRDSSGANTPSVREGGPSKLLERKTVTPTAPKPPKTPNPGKLE